MALGYSITGSYLRQLSFAQVWDRFS